MNKLETREQAEARALELYPKKYGDWFEKAVNRQQRKAFLQCWEEVQQEYENQSSNIEKEPVSAMLVNVIKYCDQNQRVQLIKALQERANINDNQDEPKQHQKELICEMMRKDEEYGLYESKRISEQSNKKVNESVDNDKLREAAESMITHTTQIFAERWGFGEQRKELKKALNENRS